MKRRKPDGRSLEDMRKQLHMHEEALADAKERRANSTAWKDCYVYDGVIKYHEFCIENYRSMIKNEEQQLKKT